MLRALNVKFKLRELYIEPLYQFDALRLLRYDGLKRAGMKCPFPPHSHARDPTGRGFGPDVADIKSLLCKGRRQLSNSLSYHLGFRIWYARFQLSLMTKRRTCILAVSLVLE